MLCGKFGLSSMCDVVADFGLVRCLQDTDRFEKDEFYILWRGYLTIGEQKHFFVCFPDEQEAVIVSKGAFEPLDEALDVWRFISGEIFWIKIVNSQGKTEIIPDWHFDCRLVKKQILPRTRFVYGKWQKVKADGNVFMSWGFYIHGLNTPVCYFNIENGRCFEPNDVTVLGNINAKRGYFLGKVPVRCHALRLSKACKREYLNY